MCVNDDLLANLLESVATVYRFERHYPARIALRSATAFHSESIHVLGATRPEEVRIAGGGAVIIFVYDLNGLDLDGFESRIASECDRDQRCKTYSYLTAVVKKFIYIYRPDTSRTRRMLIELFIGVRLNR